MADIGSDVIDQARMEEVAAAVGRQRLHELIQVLAGRIQSLADAADALPAHAEGFLAALHQSRGSAASLGFPALAEGFARVEVLVRHALGREEAGACAAWEAVRQAGRALPALWKEGLEKKEDLLF